MTHVLPAYDLDALLAQVRQPGHTLKLRPGTYTSRGSGAFPDGVGLAPGVTLDATEARIELVDPIRTDRPWVDFPWLGNRSTVKGGDWQLGDHGGVAQSGFRAVGSVYIEDASITGLRGRRVDGEGLPVKEVFVFQQEEGHDGTRICRLRAAPLHPDRDEYVAGIYTNDRGGAEVEECDMRLGPFGQFAYSCAYFTVFQHCTGDAARFFYTDDKGCNAMLRSCAGSATWAAISLVCDDVTPPPWRLVVATDCALQCEGGRVVEFDDAAGHQRAVVQLQGGAYSARWRLASTSPGSLLMLGAGEVVVETTEPDYLQNGAQGPMQT